jgi:hypothetical protein
MSWNPGTPLWAARTPYRGSGSHSRVSVRTCGGPRPNLEAQTVYTGVRHLPVGGPDSLVMPQSMSLSLDTWWHRTRPCGGVRCCCWPSGVARGWGQSWPGPTYNPFTMRLKIAAWVLCFYTAVRGTLVSWYQHRPLWIPDPEARHRN